MKYQIDELATPRDIRLSLASLLSQLEEIQSTEAWAAIATEFPALTEQFKEANTAVDSLWFTFRCATTNPGD